MAAVLTERITNLFESLKPSEEEEVSKADCLVQMRGLLKDGGIGNGIHLYGSSASLCGFGTSDMDLCLLSPPVEGDAAGEGGGDTKEGEAGGGAGAAAAAAVAAAVAGIDVVARANVLRQMEFYFSDSNLQNDRFLRGKVAEGGEEGFVDIALLNSFKRMQSYGLNDAAVCAVLRADSETLVLSDDGSAVRRKVAVGAAADLPGHTQVQRELLTEAADLLESSGAAGAFEVSVRILDARVPILKLQHRATGIECDMCVDNTLAIRNTLLLRTYASIDPRVRRLVFAVKRWAKAREIGDAHRSTLSSYAHTLTVIFYLQVGCSPPVLPSLQDPDLVGDKWAVPAEGEGGKTYDVSFCEDAAEAKAFLAGKAGESGANTQVSACVCLGLCGEGSVTRVHVVCCVLSHTCKYFLRFPFCPILCLTFCSYPPAFLSAFLPAFIPSYLHTSFLPSFLPLLLQSTGELLAGYFNFFGLEFDRRRFVMSVRTGGVGEGRPMTRKAYTQACEAVGGRGGRDWRVSIEDPFEREHDLGTWGFPAERCEVWRRGGGVRQSRGERHRRH